MERYEREVYYRPQDVPLDPVTVIVGATDVIISDSVRLPNVLI